jgi:hypothetical protein
MRRLRRSIDGLLHASGIDDVNLQEMQHSLVNFTSCSIMQSRAEYCYTVSMSNISYCKWAVYIMSEARKMSA